MNNKDFALKRLILASRSPRRAEILRAAGWPFETAPADIDESRREAEHPVSYVKRLALKKAQTVARARTEGLVLGADTTVVVDGELLGQPLDDNDARRMLKLLSGKWHEVLTGVALVRAGEEAALVDHEITRVRFSEMSGIYRPASRAAKRALTESRGLPHCLLKRLWETISISWGCQCGWFMSCGIDFSRCCSRKHTD